MRELNTHEIEEVSGGVVDRIMGSMLSIDAHNGPGGLYGPGGSLEHEFQVFEAFTMSTFGISGMAALSTMAGNEGSTQDPSAPVASADGGGYWLTHDQVCGAAGDAMALGGAAAGLGGLAMAAADGPAPFGEAAALGGMALGAVGGIIHWAQDC